MNGEVGRLLAEMTLPFGAQGLRAIQRSSRQAS